jgi:uncharacterized membrane protein YhaH (DUF805 family)
MKYAIFTGRAPRAEYWWYRLLVGFVSLGFGAIDGFMGNRVFGAYGPLGLVVMAALIVPTFAVVVRRLHDTGRSSAWAILGFVNYALVVLNFSGLWETVMKDLNPVIYVILALGFLVAAVLMFVFMVSPGNEGPNEFGPDPYGPDALEEVFA